LRGAIEEVRDEWAALAGSDDHRDLRNGWHAVQLAIDDVVEVYYRRPRWTTSGKGRRLGFRIGLSGRSAGYPTPRRNETM
jgi:hypothetical protein